MPNPTSLAAFAASAMVVAVLCTSTAARAELGGTMAVQANSTAAAPQTLLNGALRLRTLTDAGNTTINEYATNTGQIIAYAWQGPTMPDLRALLGKYADSYRTGAAALASNGNLHASRVVRPDVIVESGGPMRGYAGRAWLPAALPSGVTADDFH
ncbi:DUF2844 domain-containing protein [Paraburkholderia domus]|jgi:Protein of unknown function (DUF2844).|uniref:DUF2844 domain-containing protein n=1 Tax=Paraburkholderia domus TaxID=2793075 RepID=A0A9N8QWU8_9BURK|nr:DUF2844 domain-containing protein [Paraburkholderia domus]MBK5050030.1 DUF2844 domain-containing protein [Burkholderia sp. R-70006]MBK5063066.1 DUF2844 domain-containing protein [Burkholderia sp. R-70199]MBK5121487.1 DUF2844 domain-containing protein [Burkholderia sp. R-69980]MBK5166631.1 DUF2844 domain-containing protein [Burkholderia sp. R-70211]MBK5182505.1 DUF2844 domain-containing protein [Burkholderia sp. R-69749]MCI0147228.1 DUF2844 domain-containing protein [Paraburkholderia sedimi